MKVLNKYWESDLCLAKIKVNEKSKTIGFDFKNNRLAIVTHDRTIYFVDLPNSDPSELGFEQIKYEIEHTAMLTQEKLMEQKILCSI